MATCLLDLRFAGNGGGHDPCRGLVHAPRGLLKLGKVGAVLVSFHLPEQDRFSSHPTRSSRAGSDSWSEGSRPSVVTSQLLQNCCLWGQLLAVPSLIDYSWLTGQTLAFALIDLFFQS